MKPNLQLVDAHFAAGPNLQRTADFSLLPGQWTLLHEPRPQALLYWLDILTGLQSPLGGRVLYNDWNWSQLNRSQQLAARRKIGCISNEHAWIAQKPVLESILLPVLSSGKKNQQQWTERAEMLAREFLLPGLPLDLPATLNSADRLRATCVRALLPQPTLLIIAEDSGPDWDILLPALVNRTHSHCFAGGSVLWLTTTAQRLKDRRLEPDYRLAVTRSGTILPVNPQPSQSSR